MIYKITLCLLDLREKFNRRKEKMAKNLTELVFILDRSGSMSGLEKDTIGGFNSTIEKQKSEVGQCNVTTVLFDNLYELLHDRIPLAGILPLTEKDYYVRGSTALHDAIGLTIQKIDNVLKNTAESARADKVIFVIITDGYENSSREYTQNKIKVLIENHKELGWEFLFLGANIDAVEVAAGMGIAKDRAVDFVPDSLGTETLYGSISESIKTLRSNRQLGGSWKKAVEDDYRKRGK